MSIIFRLEIPLDKGLMPVKPHIIQIIFRTLLVKSNSFDFYKIKDLILTEQL